MIESPDRQINKSTNSTMQIRDEKFEFSGRGKTICLALVAIGILTVAIGFITGDTERTWANLLIDSYYFALMAFAGLMFCAIQYVAQAGWSAAILRIPQAFMAVIPYAAVILLIVIGAGLAGHHLYHHWADPALTTPGSPEYDEVIAGKASYMNVPMFMARLVLYLLVWGFFGWKLRKMSLQEDQQGGQVFFRKGFGYSAAFCAVFGFTFPLFAFDVMMSIEAHWFSTIFGWYNLAGMWVSGLAAFALTTAVLKERGYLQHVNENHLHDLGKFIFAFSIFWTYMWTSQLLLYWYANIPEEVVWYYNRWVPEYNFLFWLNLVINFLAPLLIFMSRDAKRKWKTVKWVSVVVILGHWLDIYLMAMPGMVGTERKLGYIELGAFLGFAGLFALLMLTALSKASLYPKNHPYMEESLHHHI